MSQSLHSPSLGSSHRRLRIHPDKVLKQLDRSPSGVLWFPACLDEDLLSPPAGPGRRRTPQHGVVRGEEGRHLPGFDLVRGIEALGFVALQPSATRALGSTRASPSLRHCTRRGEGETDPVSLEKSLDVFHTKREAQRVLTTTWNRVERLWEQAEAATRAVERAQRQGLHPRSLAHTASTAWKKASAAFHGYEEAEAAWKAD